MAAEIKEYIKKVREIAEVGGELWECLKTTIDAVHYLVQKDKLCFKQPSRVISPRRPKERDKESA